jgi:hypothetical protein
VEKELTALQVNFTPAAGGCTRELELPHNAIWDSRLLLVLRFLALEVSHPGSLPSCVNSYISEYMSGFVHVSYH